MTKLSRQVLGFDAREPAMERSRAGFPREYRERFLLRPSAHDVLSVDRHIWPSVFEYYPGTSSRANTGHVLLAVDSDCEGLWPSLPRMIRRLVDNNVDADVLIVEVIAAGALTPEGFGSNMIAAELEPCVVPENSVLLGYDVGDSGFWSALSNCGYEDEQLAPLRQQWEGRINDHGLITAGADALNFRDLAEARVPSHAPMYVYPLHLIPKTREFSASMRDRA